MWAGLVTLMAARAAAIALPDWARCAPFLRLFVDMGANLTGLVVLCWRHLVHDM